MSSPADELPVAGTVVLLRPHAADVEVLLMRRPARGSFADAWVFPGGKVEPADRERGSEEIDDARRAAIRETREEVGLLPEQPVVLSRWEPPREAPVRIRAWFFLARAPQGEATLAPDEVVDAMWIRPADAIARHAAGEWTLFPPTWLTLHHLARFETVEAALTAAGTARRFTTRVVEKSGGTAFEWDSTRLETGSLPWRLVDVPSRQEMT